MNRAFISLYLFIVLSVVVIGWGLNVFWESLEPDATASAEIKDIFSLVDVAIQQENNSGPGSVTDQLNRRIQYQIALLDPDEIASTQFFDVIKTGEIVHAIGENKTPVWYKQDSSYRWIIVITAPKNNINETFLYAGLLVIFYLGIALVVFLWIWPLSQDLAKLEQQTRQIGGEGKEEALGISARSAIFPLAHSFNKMARRIRELLNSHKEMTYAVSHELRTPLARMKFSLAMLESTHLNEQQQQQINNLNQDIHEMEELISSLLLYAGFEQSSGKLICRNGDMKALVDQILKRIHRTLRKNITFIVNDQADGKQFNCEWKLMEIVVQNLLQNALRFARSKIIITLNVSEEGEYFISVEDDGPGIPEDERERVFESFVRLYADAGNQKGGFGLGLAIVKRIVQWHNGQVGITESAVLKGGCIKITWQ